MTKEEVVAKVKEILAKDKKYKDAKVTLVFKNKREREMNISPLMRKQL